MEEIQKYYLQPGYIFVSRHPYLIHTVLGSCVAVCLWDSNLKYGGMNHYIYNKPFNSRQGPQFGSISIPYMIKLMLDMGSLERDINAHIVGGAHNLKLGNAPVGSNNIEIAEEILKNKGISITTRDTGGEMGRKVVFNTDTGELLLFKVNSIRKDDWYNYD